MSIWSRTHEWVFNKPDETMIDKLIDKISNEEWNALTEEIKSKTCLTSIYGDMVATTEPVSNDEFNDSINICLKIFKEKYDQFYN